MEKENVVADTADVFSDFVFVDTYFCAGNAVRPADLHAVLKRGYIDERKVKKDL